jgi:hypothetical protein
MIKGITHDFVDAVQNGKKQFVATTVKHQATADTMNKFIDSQSQYTKQAFDTAFDCMTSFAMLASKKGFIQEVVSAYN